MRSDVGSNVCFWFRSRYDIQIESGRVHMFISGPSSNSNCVYHIKGEVPPQIKNSLPSYHLKVGHFWSFRAKQQTAEVDGHLFCKLQYFLIYLINLELLGFWKLWIALDKLHGTILHPHQLFSRTLQRCFTVKLQKCSVEYRTSSWFPSAWGWVDNDWIFFCGWTFPIIEKTQPYFGPEK